jgi:putative membrane protein
MKRQVLTEKELKTLAGVIGECEQKTVGEMRLIIARRSSVTSHVTNTLWLSLLSLSCLLIWFERHDLVYYERWWMWPGLVFGSFIFANIFSRFEFVQRLFTPKLELHHQVMTRAEIEFHREGLNGTSAQTGVLLFVSLMERMAVVLADKGIADKVPVHAWDKVIAKILEGARSDRFAEKLEDALRECGSYLATHFPDSGVVKNELSNNVIIKD